MGVLVRSHGYHVELFLSSHPAHHRLQCACRGHKNAKKDANSELDRLPSLTLTPEQGMSTVEKVTDMAVLKPLPRSSRDPYYQYIWLKCPSSLTNVYVVVVNTDISGVVEYSNMSYNGAESVYNLKVKKKTYD